MSDDGQEFFKFFHLAHMKVNTTPFFMQSLSVHCHRVESALLCQSEEIHIEQ